MTVEFINDNTDNVGPRLIATNPEKADHPTGYNDFYTDVYNTFKHLYKDRDDINNWAVGSSYYDTSKGTWVTASSYYDTSKGTWKAGSQNKFMVAQLSNIAFKPEYIGGKKFGMADWAALTALGYDKGDVYFLIGKDGPFANYEQPERFNHLFYDARKDYRSLTYQQALATFTAEQQKTITALADAVLPSLKKNDAAWRGIPEFVARIAGDRWKEATGRIPGITGAIKTTGQAEVDKLNKDVDDTIDQGTKTKQNNNIALNTRATTLNNYDSKVVEAVNSLGEGDYLAARQKVIDAYADLNNSALISAADKLEVHKATIGELDNLYSTGVK